MSISMTIQTSQLKSLIFNHISARVETRILDSSLHDCIAKLRVLPHFVSGVQVIGYICEVFFIHYLKIHRNNSWSSKNRLTPWKPLNITVGLIDITESESIYVATHTGTTTVVSFCYSVFVSDS